MDYVFRFFVAMVLVGAESFADSISLWCTSFGSYWVLSSWGSKGTDHGFSGVVDSVG